MGSVKTGAHKIKFYQPVSGIKKAVGKQKKHIC